MSNKLYELALKQQRGGGVDGGIFLQLLVRPEIQEVRFK